MPLRSCDQSWGTCHDHSGLDTTKVRNLRLPIPVKADDFATTKALFTLLGGDPVAGGHLDCTFNLYDQEYSPGVTPTGEPVATGDGQTISSVTTKTAAVSSAAVSSPPAQSEPSTLSQQAEPSQSEGSLLDGILGTNAKVNQDDSPAASSTTAETSPPSDSPAVGTDGCEGGAMSVTYFECSH